MRLPASASLPLASCWPRPQQLLPVSATGGGRRRCTSSVSGLTVTTMTVSPTKREPPFGAGTPGGGFLFLRMVNLTFGIPDLSIPDSPQKSSAVQKVYRAGLAAEGRPVLVQPLSLTPFDSSPSRGASGETVHFAGTAKASPTRSNGDDRRQRRKQGVAVGAAASRMQATAQQTLGAATRPCLRSRLRGCTTDSSTVTERFTPSSATPSHP